MEIYRTFSSKIAPIGYFFYSGKTNEWSFKLVKINEGFYWKRTDKYIESIRSKRKGRITPLIIDGCLHFRAEENDF